MTSNVQHVVMVLLSEEEKAYLEKMRGEGGERPRLGHFVGSILRTLIADDRAAEAA